MPALESISDTARWIAAYRALESERAHATISDPFARRLAGERGFEIARRLKAGDALGPAVAVRTAMIDELILEAVAAGADAVLSLAAGLDARAWRLPLPPSLTWIEVDLPGILAHKSSVLADDVPRCRRTEVVLDLADVDARRALFARLGAEHRRVVVLTEGLLTYLAPDAVDVFCHDVHAPETFAQWIVDFIPQAAVDYSNRNFGDHLGPAGATMKFAPPGGPDYFEARGWRPRDVRWMLEAMPRVGRDVFAAKVVRALMWLRGSARRGALLRKFSGACLLLDR